MHIEADYLIIGGGIAGTTAAETIRNKDKHGTIAIISKEPHVLYSRVLLPKYVEGALARDQVFLRTAEDYNKRGISLYVDEEATVLDLKGSAHTKRRGFFVQTTSYCRGWTREALACERVGGCVGDAVSYY